MQLSGATWQRWREHRIGIAREWREATLTWCVCRGMNHGSESGRNAAPRARADYFYFCKSGATDSGAAARAPLARRTRPAAPSRRRTRTYLSRTCDCARITVNTQCLHPGLSYQLQAVWVKVAPLSNSPITVVQLVRGTRARPRTLPEEACRKQGSGASARKPPRALPRTPTPWIAPTIPESHLA